VFFSISVTNAVGLGFAPNVSWYRHLITTSERSNRSLDIADRIGLPRQRLSERCFGIGVSQVLPITHAALPHAPMTRPIGN